MLRLPLTPAECTSDEGLKIKLSGEAIRKKALEELESLKVHSIATYGWSPLVEHILVDLIGDNDEDFHIIVLDASKNGLALSTLKSLAAREVQTTYGLINAAGEELNKAQAVIIQGFRRSVNGVEMTAGSFSLALLAKSIRIPFYVVLPSYSTDINAFGEIVEVPSDLITGIFSD